MQIFPKHYKKKKSFTTLYLRCSAQMWFFCVWVIVSLSINLIEKSLHVCLEYILFLPFCLWWICQLAIILWVLLISIKAVTKWRLIHIFNLNIINCWLSHSIFIRHLEKGNRVVVFCWTKKFWEFSCILGNFLDFRIVSNFFFFLTI
jgi:hypothetical protein